MEMIKQLLVHVRYTVKPGQRARFLQEIRLQGILRESREEPGNEQYEYFLPVDAPDDLFLVELWKSAADQSAHSQTEHYQRLQALKQEYITDVSLVKYFITPAP